MHARSRYNEMQQSEHEPWQSHSVGAPAVGTCIVYTVTNAMGMAQLQARLNGSSWFLPWVGDDTAWRIEAMQRRAEQGSKDSKTWGGGCDPSWSIQTRLRTHVGELGAVIGRSRGCNMNRWRRMSRAHAAVVREEHVVRARLSWWENGKKVNRVPWPWPWPWLRRRWAGGSSRAESTSLHYCTTALLYARVPTSAAPVTIQTRQ